MWDSLPYDFRDERYGKADLVRLEGVDPSFLIQRGKERLAEKKAEEKQNPKSH